MITNFFRWLLLTFGALGVIAVLVLTILLGGLCLHYDIHYWALFIKHQEVSVPWIPCILLGPFVATVSVPVALCTWIFSFFV